MKKLIFKVALLTSFILVLSMPTIVKAQGSDPGGNTNGSANTSQSGVNTDGGPGAPFDGGMSLMFAASGVAFAAKKLKQKKEKAYLSI